MGARAKPSLWLVLGSVLFVAGCAGSGAPERAAGPGAPGAAPGGAAVARPAGPAIRVTWEALARERALYEGSKYRRPGVVAPPLRIVLVSESHPSVAQARAARTEAERQDHVGVAVVRDADMVALVRGLESRGFFRHARPGPPAEALRESPDARGLVTVERGGQTHTLVSLRGQGQNPATSAVPRAYSDAKQAVMLLRNANPTFSVSRVSRGSVQVR